MKPKKQLTEEQLAQLDKDIEFIKQSIDKAKKRLKQLKQIP
jgi:peptidoglycan hydrolase CwlO-like protein